MRTALATPLENASRPASARKITIRTTLLDLVRTVSESTDDDAEVVATIVHMLRCGRIELCGALKDSPLDEF